MSSAEVRSEAPIILPAHCGTDAADPLKAALLSAAGHLGSVRIDASQVGSLGQAAVQLLLASRTDAEARGAGFDLLAPSPHVRETLARYGLADHLAPLPSRSTGA